MRVALKRMIKCPTHLCMNQSLYVAGTFEDEITYAAWFVQGQSSPQPDPTFTCSEEEIGIVVVKDAAEERDCDSDGECIGVKPSTSQISEVRSLTSASAVQNCLTQLT